VADNKSVEGKTTSGEALKIEFPTDGKDKSVNVDFNSRIELEGIDLDEAKIDILGNDLIISDPETGAQLILVGMVLYLFDEESGLAFFMDGVEVYPQDFLSKIGEVGNLTVKDFIEISSILPEAKASSDEDADGNPEEGEKAKEEAAEEVNEALFAISTALNDAQYREPPVEEFKSNLEEEFVSSAPSTAIDEKGTSENSAVQQSSSSATSVEEDKNTFISDKTADPEPATPFDLSARLLQVASESVVEDVGGGVFKRVFDGGGGSEASFFNPDNEVQYSTEVINLTDDPSDLVVYADNPDYFDDALMSRVIEMEPILPAGFEVTKITIADLPAGFVIEGATAGADGYSIDTPTATPSGDFQVILKYGTPSTEAFTFNITLETEFNQVLYDILNPDGPSITPTETVVSFTTPQKVEVKDVFGPNDLNYLDGDGNAVWVLANDPNNNRIFTSLGDDIVYGGIGQDVINTSLGNDELYGGDGDDTLVGGGGDDLLSGGGGNDTIQGDTGVDTVDYTDTGLDVELDLGALVGGYAEANIDQAGPQAQQDRIRDVENINTGGGVDILTGDANNNVINSGDANDIIYASDGADTLDGGNDIDTVDFSNINGTSNFVSLTLDASNDAIVIVDGGVNQTVRNIENVIGTDGNDIISGDSNQNQISGGGGDDTLSGRGGVDDFDGGDGSDTVDYGAAAGAVNVDLIAGGATNDGDGAFDNYVSIENVSGSAFADNISGDNAANVLFGAGGNDQITGAAGDDTFLGSAGSDTLDGEEDSDIIDYSGLTGANFIDVTLDDSSDATVVVDGLANDTIRNIENVIGTIGDDTIIGDTQDNILDGNDGNDSLGGGAGNDTLIGGDGTDEANYSTAASGVSVDLAINSTTNDGDSGTDTLIGIENVLGSSNNDTISGDAFVNNLQGNGGDDFLAGRGGNDQLDGGAGSDTADYSNAAASIFVDMSTGGAINDGDGGTDTFVLIENIRGSAQDDTITGDAFDNVLSGDDGDDILDGDGGDDTIRGDDGDDLLLASDGADTLDGGDNIDMADYSGLAGIDSISVVLAGSNNATVTVANGTNDIITNVENITATSGDDNVTGDFFGNVILGLAGDDTIGGSAGNDTLDGGVGTDILSYSLFTGLGISLNIAVEAAASLLDGSTDTFRNFESYITTQQDDLVTGSNAADIVSTLNGDDIIFASAGTDTIDGGGASDTIDYSGLAGVTSVDVTLNAAIDAFVTVGGGDVDTIRNIENVIGSIGDDTLTGDDQDNNLQGNAGKDILSGGEGDDKLEGGLGDDTLIGGAGDDKLIGGSGNDTADYSAAAAVVNANLASGDAILDGDGGTDQLTGIENLIGSANNDSLVGNGVANVIDGGLGNDVIRGGAGSDTLTGGLGNDDIRFDDLTGQGVTIDITSETATYAVDGSTDNFSGFERYFTTNQGDIITGSAAVDTIFALGGNDILNATAGSDILDGGADNDTIDYSTLGGITNIDVTLDGSNIVIVDVVDGDDDSIVNIENITGSAGNDSITGDEFRNTLSGAGGDDVLRGGGGDDDLDGGAGTDTVRFDDLTGTGIVLDIAAGTANYAGDGTQDTLSNFEIYYASNQNDIITGSVNADNVFALVGDDLFDASAGNDILDGGAGSDTIDYSGLSGITSINAALSGAVNSNITVVDGDDDSVVNIENIIGSIGDDTLTGDTFANTLDGNAGDDILAGGGGGDNLFGGAGDDILDGGSGADVHAGGAGADTLLGSAGNDIFIGGDDIDNIDYSGVTGPVNVNLGDGVAANDGQGGNDSLSEIENVTGSDFNDVISGDSNVNVLTGGFGNDRLYGAGGSDLLDGGAGVDEVDYTNAVLNGVTVDLGTGTAADDGDGGVDTLTDIENITGSTFSDDLTGDANVNVIDGGTGDDIIRASGGEDVIDGGDDRDTIDYSNLVGATSIDVTLAGVTPVNVSVTGGADQTILNVENVTGTDGDDTITGDANENTLKGGAGNDTLSGRGGVDILDGGDGIDTADYSSAVGGINANLAINTTSIDGFGTSDTLIDIENITGSTLADTITGDASDNIILGNVGADTLDGGAGDDAIDGGAGVDIIKAGAGDDSYTGGTGTDELTYENDVAGVTVDLTAGTATDGTGDTDSITTIENLTGSDFDDDLTGSIGDNVIIAGDGDDIIDGGAGNDTLTGGSGVDTASFLSAVAGVSVNLALFSATGDGNDTLNSIENVIGSDNNDVILGDGNANNLRGEDGNDRIYGAGGNDVIDGGDGIDEVDYTSAAAGVTVDLTGGETVVDGDGGADTLTSIENVTGSAFDDDIAGDANTNIINAGAGNDEIYGTDGADQIDGGAGLDTIDYSLLSSVTSVNLTLNGTSEITVNLGTGFTQKVSNVENVTASDGDDILIGDANDNILRGGAGNDILSGRGGVDTLDGGADNDIADYSNAVGGINVNLDGGVASVDGDGSNDILIDIENVTGSASADIIVGDTNANILNGRGGDDRLDGAEGDDTLLGGAGNDIFLSGAGDDVITGGSGVDKVDYTLATGDVTVDLSASSVSNDGDGGIDTITQVEDIVGSVNNDTLTGDNTDNDIDGGTGNDIIAGLGGADTFDGGAGTDTVDYSRAAGNVIIDLSTGNAVSDGDGSADTLSNIENITGSDGDDILRGDNISNVINGGDGNDSLRGAGGSDTLNGGDGIDEVDYSLAAGDVTVNLAVGTSANDGDGSSDTLSNIENIIGSNNDDDLTGNASDNNIDAGVGNDRLVGGSGDDALDGGTGTDTVDYSNATGSVTANMFAGTVTDDGEGDTDSISNIENFIGSDFADDVTGDNENNDIDGGDGDDVLRGRAGDDRLTGGDGEDTVSYNLAVGNVTSDLQAGTTSDDGNGGTDTLIGVENLTGSANIDNLRGDATDNNLLGLAGDDVLRGRVGNDRLDGGAGNDTAEYIDAAGSVTIDLSTNLASDDGDGDVDTLVSIENVTGSGNSDSITGDAGANTLDGGAGDDTLIGGAGADDLIGGAGIDEINYSGAAGLINVNLDANIVGNDGDGSSDITDSIENVTGSNFDDVISGNGVINLLSGGLGNDTLYGAGGNDTLDGGSGIDEADYSNSAAGITVDLGLVTNQTSQDGDGGVDTLISVENIKGSTFSDDITGDVNVNIIDAGTGDDLIRASSGADVVDGNVGSDTITYEGLAGATSINVVLSGASDTTVTVGGLGIAQTIVNIENVIGTSGDDIIDGDAEDNILIGGIGTDVIRGGVGSDTLDGGGGGDELRFDDLAGLGIVLDLTTETATYLADTDNFSNFETYYTTNQDDIITGSGAVDVVFGLAGDDKFNATAGADDLDGGAGTDTIDFTLLGGINFINLTLAGAVDTTVTVDGGTDQTISNIENVIGSTGDDIITGDALDNEISGGLGEDILNGGAGADLLEGNAGADTFTGSAGQNTYDGGADIDTLDYSAQTSANYIEVTLNGAGNAAVLVDGETNDVVRNVENVVGTDGNDIIRGDGADNHLEGGIGDDTLSGGGGVGDYLDGGVNTAIGDTVDYSTNLGLASVVLTLNGAIGSRSTVNGVLDDTVINIENVIGSIGADIITGDAGINTIDGHDGNDILVGGGGSDFLDGGDGIDTVDYSVEADATAINVNLNGAIYTTVAVTDGDDDQLRNIENVIGTTGDDTIIGDTGDNLFVGLGGNDTFSGFDGNDTFDGGSGTDLLSYSYSTDSIVVDMSDLTLGYFDISVAGGLFTDTATSIENLDGSFNNDTITGTTGINYLRGLAGNDTIDGGADNDIIDGGAGDDTILGGDGNDILNGDDGDDTIDGGLGNDIINAGDGFFDVIIASAGNDIIDGGTTDQDFDYDEVDYSGLTGIDHIEVVLDGSNDSTVTVVGGDDDTIRNIEVITGSTGNDLFTGDTRNNFFFGDDGNDTFFLAGGDDEVIGGDGVDRVDYSGSATRIEVNAVSGAVNFFNIVVGAGVEGDQARLVEEIVGSDFNDYIRTDRDLLTYIEGGAGNDRIDMNATGGSAYGGTGNDSLFMGWQGNAVGSFAYGEDGNDILQNWDHGSTLDGGDGTDTARYFWNSGGITVVLQDVGDTTVTIAGKGTDTIRNIENIEGSNNANDYITGNSSANTILGHDGNDYFTASLGGDTYYGGSAGSEYNQINYSSLNGTVSSIAVTLNGNSDATVTLNGIVENDTVRSIRGVIGTDGNDDIRGGANTEWNRLFGEDGDDYIHGGNGGQNTLDGGNGNDTIDGAVTQDTIYGRADNDIINGNDGSDFLYGGTGNDTIDGGDGNDEVYGEAGDDLILVSNGTDLLDGGADIDTLSFSSLVGQFVVLDLSGPLTTYGTSGGGGGNLTNFENYILSDGNDLFTGTAGDDTVIGGDGDDTFFGSDGADNFDGGIGNDTADYSSLASSVVNVSVVLQNTGDSFVNITGGLTKIDTLTGIENVTGSTQDDSLTGNNLDNVLIGNQGNDVISGNAGNDTLTGGAGDDTLAGGAGDDTLTGGDGIDTVDYSASTGDLNINLTTTVGTGEGTDSLTGIENVIGGAGNDTITGDTSDNTFDGGMGNDTLIGVSGDNIFITSAGNDTFTGGSGLEDLVDYSSSASAVNVDLGTGDASGDGTDTLSGIENVIGTAGDDTIVSNASDNELDGGGNTGVGDTVSYASAAGPVVVDLSAGTATGDGNDELTGFENIIGSSNNDRFVGDNANNDIDGGAGNDDLIDYSSAGGALNINLDSGFATGQGTDSLSNIENVLGGAGNDVIEGNSLDNDLDGGGGTANTVSYSSATSAVNVNLRTGTASGGAGNDTLANFTRITGSIYNDTFVGSAGDNIIDGGFGNDDLVDYSTSGSAINANLLTGNTTGDGTDLLVGIENITGTSGDDTFVASSANNTINGGVSGNDTVSYLGAGDVVINLASQTATGSGSDNFVSIENATGGAGNDTITGSAADNVLIGGDGNDTIDGGAGDDIIDGGDGIDTVSYASAVGGVTVNLASGAAGNDTISNVENIIGSGSDDMLTGNGVANVINAGAGNDIVNAGDGSNDGNDTFHGEAGTGDTLDYSNGGSGFTGGELSLTTGSVSKAAGDTDTFTGFENIIMSTGSDTISINTDSVAVLSSVDGEAGVDHIDFIGANTLTDNGIDGADLAGLFSDVEELDFTSTDLTGGDFFDIGNDEINTISGNNSLTIFVDTATIALTDFTFLDQNGATSTIDDSVLGQRTVDWDNGTSLTIQSA